ncbi:malonyl-CoA-acyl carrier protein transacylase, mitochondrial-like isoform X2 [Acanthaster planci]|uniref:Malonyl-CoA-acyl carrier protein transacylase, mitochondrial-like isoform X2 n=1 Tax=Acanthaster planci TaxID=133434 RepID=A0A8B7YIG9_ACAPL|nr:malonyl-CoA-acyl carrier protein transacylase, mitochondrial-like isoform X2 [Acanthaster planci]XP_022092201.1 malonyl-CoA-acyl carrier protein transacylase, mitochondrial-like isoform X2 [Acanthaster planci]
MHPASLMRIRNVYTLSQAVLRSRCHYPRCLKQERTGLDTTGLLQGRHLGSVSRDGDRNEMGDSTSARSGMTENSKNRDQVAKSMAAQRIQSMHKLLDEAQVEEPRKDFDFSDIPQRREARLQSQKAERPKLNPREMTAFLFPGQGTQFPGMGHQLLQYPNVKQMFSIASEILGYDLLDLCLNGSKEELNRTVHSQPAVVVCSLAAVEKLKEDQPKAVANCVAASGFSVGEFSALVFSGALSFEDAIHLIKIRAEAMQHASELVSSGMLSVIGRRGVHFKMICREAMDACILDGIKVPVCTIASHLFPEAKVIAGHTKALDFIQEMSRHYSLRAAKRVPVSGAFHSPLMAPAKDAFYSAVDRVPFDTPVISVHSNVNGKRYRHAKHIRTLLKRQLLEPIHWEQTMHEMYQRNKGQGFPKTYEVGPGRQLGGFLERNNLKAFHSYTNIDV